MKSGAGNETRTRDPNLGKVVLYQLSYSRLIKFLGLLILAKHRVVSIAIWQVILISVNLD